MKSHTLILSLIALLLIVSCSKNEYLDATIDQLLLNFLRSRLAKPFLLARTAPTISPFPYRYLAAQATNPSPYKRKQIYQATNIR